jgi:dephospho-CoA kinase
MLVVALTGGIGSGKSLAGEYFSQLGAIVVDSDQLARDVIERGSDGFDEVVARFGDEILSNGDIDRKKLGAIVFSDPQALTDLEGITHPRIQAAFAAIVEEALEDSIVINQIPLLIETGGVDRFDRVVVVLSDLEIRKERLKARGMTTNEINRRLNAQASDEDRLDMADYIIENNGSTDDLLREVEETYRELLLEIHS